LRGHLQHSTDENGLDEIGVRTGRQRPLSIRVERRIRDDENLHALKPGLVAGGTNEAGLGTGRQIQFGDEQRNLGVLDRSQGASAVRRFPNVETEPFEPGTPFRTQPSVRLGEQNSPLRHCVLID
jgi:hypothetical protein